MKMKKIIIVALFGLAILIAGAIIVANSQGEDNLDNEQKYIQSSQHKGLTTRAPIYINGNSNFTAENGVSNPSAAGTESDPYIIENWDIDASTVNGIFIMNTTANFVIRNCLLHNGWRGYWKDSHYGICFYLVQNGAIEDVASYDNYHGLWLDSSSNIQITNCTVYNNKRGIDIDKTNNNTMTNCGIYNNLFEGVFLYSSSNNSITGSAFYNNRIGIYMDWDSDNNQITNCSIYNNYKGIELRSSISNQIAKCYCYNNSEYGISFMASSNNTIANCTVYNNEAGIHLYYSSNDIITNCTISNNDCGIRLDKSSNNNTICYNQFIDNREQLYDEGSNYWYNNEFIKTEKPEERGWLNWLWENRMLMSVSIVVIVVAGAVMVIMRKRRKTLPPTQ